MLVKPVKPVVKPKSARKSPVKPLSVQPSPEPEVQESQPVLEYAQRKSAFPVTDSWVFIFILQKVAAIITCSDLHIINLYCRPSQNVLST